MKVDLETREQIESLLAKDRATLLSIAGHTPETFGDGPTERGVAKTGEATGERACAAVIKAMLGSGVYFVR